MLISVVGTMPQRPCAPFHRITFFTEHTWAVSGTAQHCRDFFFAAVAKQLQPGVKKPLCARVGEDGQSAWKGSGWQWWVMDAAQPQSPQRLGGYLLQQIGFCTFSTVIHDWKRGTLCVTGYQRFWCGVTQREDKVATKKPKNGQAGCTGTRVSNVLQCWSKNTKYALVSDHIIHAGNNACISSFWEKHHLFFCIPGSVWYNTFGYNCDVAVPQVRSLPDNLLHAHCAENSVSHRI